MNDQLQSLDVRNRRSLRLFDGVNAIVLGASGFVGRWVARALCARGAKVHLAVRDKAIAENILSKYRIHGRVYELNLQNAEAIGKLLRKIRPSITFNLAGYGVDRSERDEETAYQINAHLVKAVGEAVAETRDPNWLGQDIVHVGSALECGAIGGDLSEDSIPNPTTLYGKSKLAGAQFLALCCEARKIKGLTARLFTVYGPGEHDGRLLPSLLESARTKKLLPLTAGTQKRDFTYVEDVAEGLLRLGLATTAPGDIVNLATGKLVSVRSFAETAARVLGISSERLKFGIIPTRAEEMEHDEVTLERLRRLIDWIPPTSIKEGISKTLEFENRHGITKPES